MLIFNTTYLVKEEVYDKWIRWIREQHIPGMLATGFFSNPQVARVLSNEQQDGTSYAAQFYIADMPALHTWNTQYGMQFQTHCEKEFGTDVIFFTSVLEVLP